MITKTVDLLGHRARDKITGYEGVISSICFDLYGCVQAAITPAMNEKGELPVGQWFDVARLDILQGDAVMQRPDFEARAPEPRQYQHGAAEKPAFRSPR
jgi:hypothetical protein